MPKHKKAHSSLQQGWVLVFLLPKAWSSVTTSKSARHKAEQEDEAAAADPNFDPDLWAARRLQMTPAPRWEKKLLAAGRGRKKAQMASIIISLCQYLTWVRQKKNVNIWAPSATF